MSDANAQHLYSASETESEEDLLSRMQQLTAEYKPHTLSQHERVQNTRGEAVDASTNEEYRDLTFQDLMMQREWILAERNIISHQLSLLDDIIKAKIEENQYVTSSTGVNSKKETCIEEESGSQKPSPRRYGSDPKQRQLEGTFLGREISFPSKKSIQESDDGGSSVLKAARKTAQLVESSTNFPPTMLAPLDA
eukprot:scaffold443_cov138-Skeletonema_menzelii.AAC.2